MKDSGGLPIGGPMASQIEETTLIGRSKVFVPGQGYTREDWDAVDSPELTDEEIASLRPAREVLPPELFAALTERKPPHDGRHCSGEVRTPTLFGVDD
jgi:uncharacterized protein (DUF4415 family)